MSKLVDEKVSQWSLAEDIKGGEILKHIGSEVIYVKCKKNPENGGWENELSVTTIEFLGDYDPMTGTYRVCHKLKDGAKVETRIISAGFEWGDPEERGETSRLIPMSEHYRLMEENQYYERLRDNYFKGVGVLGLEQIESLSKHKSDEGLKHILWVAAVIDSETDLGVKKGILTFRITGIQSLQRRSKSWSFYIRDEKGDLILVPKFTQREDGTWFAKDFSYGGQVIGDLKIMDIESPMNA